MSGLRSPRALLFELPSQGNSPGRYILKLWLPVAVDYRFNVEFGCKGSGFLGHMQIIDIVKYTHV